MINRLRRRSFGLIVMMAGLVTGGSVLPAHADEIWVAPTHQADLGGPGIASNIFWPVTPIGAVRFAWAVPNNLQTFQSAKVVIIPHSPGGAANLNLFICPAQNTNNVQSACAGPFAQAYTGAANQLVEVDVSAIVAPMIGVSGSTYLAVLAYATPTTTTDHMVGLRFAFTPTAPGANTVGTNQVINDSLTASDLAADSVTASELAANSVGASEVAFNYAASASEGGPATDLACVGCVSASEVSFSFATLGANTFSATQTINTGNLDLDTSTATTGNLTKNGLLFLHNFGINNTFIGQTAGNTTMTGSGNTATGINALTDNITGTTNTAIGNHALTNNTTGSSNTAVGSGALSANTEGFQNTASGFGALQNNTTGTSNVAVGLHALFNNTSGGNNVAVGNNAGNNATTGSNNIYLGNSVLGVAGEANSMYLGNQGTTVKTIIGGIFGATVSAASDIPVMVDMTGKLGTVSSSRRFKEDIHDMADASRRLFQLRPVTFRYKQAAGDGSKPIRFGLIAEEVAESFPELAVRNAAGEVETVHYERLSVLLLNELQKQQHELTEERTRNDAQQARIDALEQRLNKLLDR